MNFQTKHSLNAGHSSHFPIVSLQSCYQIKAELGNDQKSEVFGRVWHQTTVGSQIPERRIAKKMAALPLQTTWRHTKALLFQAVPPLDLAYLRDGLKNAFIIPQNTSATLIGELKPANRPAAVVIGTLPLWPLQTDYSRSWTNTRVGAHVRWSVTV